MSSQSQSFSEGLSLSEFMRVLKHRKFLIIVIVFLVVLTAAAVTMTLPKWYKATTGIRVEKPEGKVSLFDTRSSAASYDPYFVNEQLEILTSRKILMPVIEQEDLISFISEKEGFNLSPEDTYRYFKYRMLGIDNATGTALIDINVSVKEDPIKAAQIANRIADVYAQDRVAFAVSDQTESIAKLREELDKQQKEVDRRRDEVERLRSELNISGIDMESDNQGVELETVRLLERGFLNAQVDAIAQRTRWEQFAAIPEDERIRLANSQMIKDTNIIQLMEAFLIAEQNFTQLRGRLGEKHPDFIGSRDTMQTMRMQLIGLLEGYEKALEMTYRESEARMLSIEAQLQKARVASIRAETDRMRPFEDAVNRLEYAEQVMKGFELTLRQREIDFTVPKRTIEVLNPAVPPKRADSPKVVLNVAVAAVFGLVLGLGCAFLSEFIDTSFRTVDDMERMLDLPILGVVTKKLFIVRPETANATESEPYRVIQTNVELAYEDAVDDGTTRGLELKQKPVVVTVQSAGPGEGKSTTLHNIAAITALSGHKVLIIDSDLRRPSQHRILELNRKPGLIDFLTGEVADESAIIQQTETPGLDFIGAGHHVNHFSLSVLHRQQLSAMLERLRGHYDWIFLDSPPIIGISDSSMLAKEADGVIFVVQHKRNPSSMTLRAKQIIENVSENMLGVVLNQVPQSGSEDYNYYTRNYDYYGGRPDRDDSAPKKTDKGGKASAAAKARQQTDTDLLDLEDAEGRA